MKWTRLFLLLCYLAVLPYTASASEVSEFTLENGLRILIVEDHKAPVATFQIWYRTGAKDEPAGKSGLSHLLEHLMFKGTPSYGPAEFSKFIQRNGGTDNAYTTKDFTVYFELLSSDRIALPIALESDRMQNLLLNANDFLSERKVVMEERRMRYEDDPQSSLYEELMAMAFKVHPYQRPVIGWMSDLNAIEREDLHSYYKERYEPQNALIVIVGDVNPADLYAKIKKAFGNIPGGEPATRARAAEPEQRGERRVKLKREAELPHVAIAYHVPSFPHKDAYALDVLSVILSVGNSSRLYQSLVYDKKIALHANAEYNAFNLDPFLFFFSATASPGKDIGEIEKAMYGEMEKLKKEAPSSREIMKAKNQIEASFIIEQDSIFVQAMKYGTFEMLGGWRLIEEYLNGIRKVTAEEVSEVARKYLAEENRNVGVLTPVRKEGLQ